MTGVTGLMALNPGLQVTPLNFRSWLRNSLNQYIKEQGQPGVVALVFLTPHYVNAIGRKKLEKMLTDAAQKHKSWLRAINIMNTPKAMADEEVEQMLDEMLREAAEREAASRVEAHLGYARSVSDEPDATPVCLIRQAREKDLEVLHKSHVQFKAGDWYVMGEVDGRQGLSQPLKSLEEAQEYAGDFFNAKHFAATEVVTV